jgi:crotonobetainyl-CoA:carnitine CoA-transferase CaiB-like acyl-CoA transferase
MTGPLIGIRVLDLSRVLAGPFCTMILADLGADVMKVERPGVGDDLRSWGPPFTSDGTSTYYIGVNRNKRSIGIDLRTAAGREAVRLLAARSDVMIENFRVGALDAMGIGAEALQEVNPGLVCCRISGYGRQGPWAEHPGYDVLIQAFSGLMSVTGEPDAEPTRVGVAVVDLTTGLYAAVGILAALQERSRTGKGQVVDLSLLETSLSLLPNLTSAYLLAGATPQRFGNGHPNVTPYGVYPSRDGHVVIAVGNDEQWTRLCAALDLDGDDVRYRRNDDRIAWREDVEDLVSTATRARTTQELVDAFTAHSVPHGPVNTVPEVLNHPQVKAIDAIAKFGSPGTAVEGVRSPLSFSAGRRQESMSAPALGADTADVMRAVGLSEAEIQRLARDGAFGECLDPHVDGGPS